MTFPASDESLKTNGWFYFWKRLIRQRTASLSGASRNRTAERAMFGPRREIAEIRIKAILRAEAE